MMFERWQKQEVVINGTWPCARKAPRWWEISKIQRARLDGPANTYGWHPQRDLSSLPPILIAFLWARLWQQPPVTRLWPWSWERRVNCVWSAVCCAVASKLLFSHSRRTKAGFLHVQSKRTQGRVSHFFHAQKHLALLTWQQHDLQHPQIY